MKSIISAALKCAVLIAAFAAHNGYAQGSSIDLSCSSPGSSTCTASGFNGNTQQNISSFIWQATNVSMTILNGTSVNITCVNAGLGHVTAMVPIDDGNTGIPSLSATAIVYCPS